MLKVKQLEAIEAVYGGQDVFLWFPTGYGKSICYQVLLFLFDYKLNRTNLPSYKCSVCIVVSPLISLIVNQVTELRDIGIGASILSGNSGVDKSLLASEEDIELGTFSLLYSTPEALLSDRWRDRFIDKPLCDRITALAVDEAHCVFKWGDKFRPS